MMSVEVNSLKKAKGCLFGLAIGDAMGMPTSFLTPAEIQRTFGVIQDFQEPPHGHIYHQGLHRGEVTDDTEQALALARSFIRLRQVDPNDIVQELQAWAQKVEHKYASPFGPSTQQAIEQIRNGIALKEAGRNGETNGAAMRIAPLGIIHGIRGSSLKETLYDVALTCLPTHGTQVAISATTAVAWSIALCFRNHLSIADVLEGAEEAAEAGSQIGCPKIAPSVARRIAWVRQQCRRKRPREKALADLYALFGGGVLAADSVPVALGVFAFCQGDPCQIILTAANYGGDSDTIGAIAAAIGGAYRGDQAFPAEWVNTVQQVNRIDLSILAEALVSLAQHWQPCNINQVATFFEGGAL